MREFKFRFWDGQNINYVSKDEELQLIFGMNDNWCSWCPYEEVANGDDKENKLMQYTGLKDKSGKEIYEGDILLYKDMTEREHQMVVTWSEKDAAFLLGWVRTDYAVKFGEVIGNIYENPDLIY